MEHDGALFLAVLQALKNRPPCDGRLVPAGWGEPLGGG